MNSLVVLNLGKGNCHEGLPIITAQLWLKDSKIPIKFTGSLPEAADLPKLYRRWRALYEALHQSMGWRLSAVNPIEFETELVTNVSRPEFYQLCDQLQLRINQWFNASGFRTIDQQLRTKLDPNDSIRIIIETEDPLLQKLPWHLWHFFEHYTKAEIALSSQEYEQVNPLPTKITPRIRILVVLGQSDKINLQPDRTLLEQLPDAETIILTEPKRADLDRWLWDEAGWDILFFAGHSTSQGVDDSGNLTGQIFINAEEHLSIAQLRNALKASIARGLKLAIFNSCDGLELARALADLNLPQLIVMREPVTDQVAHTFLQNFLYAFSHGEEFYTAVRHAREQLQGLEGDFPCASWLPVIYQNPTEVPFTWAQLLGERQQRKALPNKQDKPATSVKAIHRRRVLLTSIAVTLLVMGVRTLGWLEPWELSAYDQLMRSRPAEGVMLEIDPRLLVVEITKDDVEQYGYPIKDEMLATALGKLQQHEPRAIGVDLHRQQPHEPGRVKLIEQFQKSQNLITVCSFTSEQPKLLSHPPEFSNDQASTQVGFSDAPVDGSSKRPVIRRHLISYDPSLTPGSRYCATPYSFSFHLMFRFLNAEGVTPLEANQDGNWQFGSTVFKRLSVRTGGYQSLDGQISQVLLNYRFNPRPAQRVTLSALLDGNVSDSFIRDRIVLLGMTAPVANDEWETPYGILPGVWIHAHSISQILGAVLDNRTLIWVLPQWGGVQWGDLLWIWSWALLGGVIIWRLRSPLLLALVGVVTTVGLYQICLWMLVKGGWMPLIPSLLALIGTGGLLMTYRYTTLHLNLNTLFKRKRRR
ncbi:MAG: CHASE2 domain-containing protein [Cyanobacteria bacterium P01_D01_bin.56]